MRERTDCFEPDIVSYRVREFDKNQFVVESYSMQIRNEIASYDDLFFREKQKYDYPIRYHSFLNTKEKFRRSILIKSHALGYFEDFDENFTLEWDSDKWNEFLATHYFWCNVSKNEQYHQELLHLNALASQFNNTYNYPDLEQSKNDSNIKERLSKSNYFLRDKIQTLECINVGQANFTIGYTQGSEKPKAIFDIGVRSPTSKNRIYAQNKLKQINDESVIVISHYDFDHINGYRYLSPKVVDRIWILPDKRPFPSPAERNFLNFLKYESCVFLKNIDYAKTPFNPLNHVLTIGNLRIYQGNAQKTDLYQSTDENARSLMCLVKNRKSILLPADCLYQEFPCEFDVDYMLVPHHACHYDSNISNIKISALKKIIIFAGPHKGYKHPNLSHIRRLIGSKNMPTETIYLMNHNQYCFDGARELNPCPYIIKSPSYKIQL